MSSNKPKPAQENLQSSSWAGPRKGQTLQNDVVMSESHPLRGSGFCNQRHTSDTAQPYPCLRLSRKL